MTHETYKELSTPELLQWYANAKRTASCGGRFKGMMNDDFYRKYALELRERGVIVPSHLFEKVQVNVEIPEGEFNGQGSF
jgi:hypothetical protein